jgi:predicted nucleotidyltransferase component of viral defense system
VPRFRDSNEFGPTLDAAAERLGVSVTAVEKDYWVSEVLRVLARDFGRDFIFKGGTSLSKAYRIVERFSEDIDVLVLPGERGLGATDKLMKQMSDTRPLSESVAKRHRSADPRGVGTAPTT